MNLLLYFFLNLTTIFNFKDNHTDTIRTQRFSKEEILRKEERRRSSQSLACNS